MISFFPAIYPDELVYSWFSRVSDLMLPMPIGFTIRLPVLIYTQRTEPQVVFPLRPRENTEQVVCIAVIMPPPIQGSLV